MSLYFELSELVPEDQIKIKAFLRYRRHNDSNYRTEHPWVGQRIWRPVHVLRFSGKLIKEPWDDLLIQDSMTQSATHPVPVKIVRARRRGVDSWVANDADARGIICLCFEPVPADWTYFEIQKVHFLESSLVVRPVAGERRELLDKF